MLPSTSPSGSPSPGRTHRQRHRPPAFLALPPPGTPADLQVAADAVDAALTRSCPDEAGLVRVVGGGGSGQPAELAWRPLGPEHDHPRQALWGFVAPPEWWAIGVTAAGRARHLDRGGEPAPVRVTALFDRAGAAAGMLRHADRAVRVGEPPEGVVADACRRALGLATAPPPGTTAALWTSWWLDRVIEAGHRAAASPGALSWADAVALHPAPARSRPDRGARRPVSAGRTEPDALVAACLAAADAWPWARVRADPTVAAVPDAPLPAAIAAWMDDGMCARWLLSAFPAPADLLAMCRAVLPAPLADRVAAAAEPALEAGGLA